MCVICSRGMTGVHATLHVGLGRGQGIELFAAGRVVTDFFEYAPVSKFARALIVFLMYSLSISLVVPFIFEISHILPAAFVLDYHVRASFLPLFGVRSGYNISTKVE